jgi:hypothetical protein
MRSAVDMTSTSLAEMTERPIHQIRRVRFQAAEDDHLMDAVFNMGTASWTKIASEVPGRTARQCRERWTHYLCTGRTESSWTEEEDLLLIEKIGEVGPRWVHLASLIGTHTDVEVKRRWTYLFRYRREDLRDAVVRARSSRKTGEAIPSFSSSLPTNPPSEMEQFDWISEVADPFDFFEMQK